MEGDECSTLIASRELASRVEHHIHRSPVRRIARDRERKFAAAPTGFAVAAILGVQQQLLLAVVEKAIGPAEIQSQGCAVHRLSRTLRILLRAKFPRPQNIQLVAAVHYDVHRPIVPGNGWLLAEPGHKLLTIRFFLVQLVLVELPDAAMGLQQRTRILPRDALLPIQGLAGIGGRADIDVQRTLAVERYALVVMLMLCGQVLDDDLGGSGGL